MRRKRSGSSSPTRTSPSRTSQFDLPAVLFDLDGTLIDSNYDHVAAWSEALHTANVVIPMWKIHHRIGMSGKSFLRELLRETSHRKWKLDLEKLEEKHDAIFQKRISKLQPLPGANELLEHLSRHRIAFAIATTGGRVQTEKLLRRLKIPPNTPVVNGDEVEKAKPSPDIFLLAAQRLNVPIDNCIVIGDSVWDVLAAGRRGALGVGLLAGGYAPEDLERAGAFRVYTDPADVLMHLEQLGLPGAKLGFRFINH